MIVSGREEWRTREPAGLSFHAKRSQPPDTERTDPRDETDDQQLPGKSSRAEDRLAIWEHHEARRDAWQEQPADPRDGRGEHGERPGRIPRVESWREHCRGGERQPRSIECVSLARAPPQRYQDRREGSDGRETRARDRGNPQPEKRREMFDSPPDCGRRRSPPEDVAGMHEARDPAETETGDDHHDAQSRGHSRNDQPAASDEAAQAVWTRDRGQRCERNSDPRGGLHGTGESEERSTADEAERSSAAGDYERQA